MAVQDLFHVLGQIAAVQRQDDPALSQGAEQLLELAVPGRDPDAFGSDLVQYPGP